VLLAIIVQKNALLATLTSRCASEVIGLSPEGELHRVLEVNGLGPER
jgi:hypothetical protein